MRVVAGSLGGRRLATPPGRDTRPTTELVRGSIFNSLESRGLLDDARVVDLFAGSGALGIEALSRGAVHATFVDSDRRAVETIRANLASLHLGLAATVVQMPIERWLGAAPGGIDVVFADPPYDWEGWDALLDVLSATVVVAEADREIVHPAWEVGAVRRHGGTVVSQLRPRGVPSG